MGSVAILGNIGSGKSELAEALARELDWTYVPEPVQHWLDSGFLEASYTDPGRYAFPFQLYAFHTRCDSYRCADAGGRVYDSHLVSDRAFMLTQFELGHLNEMDVKLYNKACDQWEKEIETSAPDLYIYLDLAPSACLKRIIEDRKRPEETGIQVEYLSTLGRQYETLIESLGEDKVVRVDASASRQAVLEHAIQVCGRNFH